MDAISSLKLADLKRELKARNLPIGGTKQILVDRLLEAMSAEKATADDSNIDDLLDEDSMLGEEESDAGSGDENVTAADLTISSPTTTVPPTSLSSPKKAPEPLKRAAPSPAKAEQNGNSAVNKDGPPPSKKKIILNREPIPEEAPPILPSVTAETVAASKKVSESKRDSIDSTGEKAVIKLSEVTAASITDKLKLRQEKFGTASTGTPDVADKLKKRAERFGIASPVGKGTGKVSLTPEDQEKIAKRRERFGLTTDDKVDELKLKRAERFGAAATATKSSTVNSSDLEDKKKARAARFAAL